MRLKHLIPVHSKKRQKLTTFNIPLFSQQVFTIEWQVIPHLKGYRTGFQGKKIYPKQDILKCDNLIKFA